ncbi:MAG: hypothetical protein DRR19_31620 [Candidatus Parabeggiatoa sp. nov. 1]|nr:MAG: hypothetical protein DRR19_31620 [Gammaproteobacteria bacterium]
MLNFFEVIEFSTLNFWWIQTAISAWLKKSMGYKLKLSIALYYYISIQSTLQNRENENVFLIIETKNEPYDFFRVMRLGNYHRWSLRNGLP